MYRKHCDADNKKRPTVNLHHFHHAENPASGNRYRTLNTWKSFSKRQLALTTRRMAEEDTKPNLYVSELGWVVIR